MKDEEKKKESKALAVGPKAALVERTPMDLVAMAIDKNLDVEKLQKLVEMQRDYNKDRARAAFFDALSHFQSECPVIKKTKKVYFEHKDGTGKTEYWYAPLDEIAKQIRDAMQSNFLTYRWEMKDEKDSLIVTCIITHNQGHCESTTMSALADPSGKKNAIQQRGSAVTYLRRYTLLNGLGITSADQDIDGRGEKQPPKQSTPEDLLKITLEAIAKAKTGGDAISIHKRAAASDKFDNGQVATIYAAANARAEGLDK
jgi:hypothetical protein